MPKTNIPVCIGIVPVAAVILLEGSGCRTKLNPALDGFSCDDNGICWPVDGGADSSDVPGDGDAAGDAEVGGGAILISMPAASPTYTNGTVVVQVSFVPPASTPTNVELLKNDAQLAVLTSPSFSFSWDTTGDAEGNYALTARMTIGGQTVTSNSVTIVVDRTAPSVKLESRVPAPGATEVSLEDPVLVTFSEPIAPAIVANAVTVSQSSGRIATTETISSDGTMLTVAIKDRSSVVLDPTAPATLSALVSQSVTDLAGNPIMAPPQWSWTVPLWLDFGTVRGESPRLAIDAMGAPILSTAFEPGAIGSGIYNLQISRHIQGNKWDTSIPSPQSATSAISYGVTSIALDAGGKPIVAWSEAPDATQASSVHVARWSGVAWESHGVLDQVAGSQTNAFNPWLATDPQDDLFVAWAEIGTNDATDVYAGRWTGTTFSLLAPISVIGANAPVMVVGSDRQPVVEWSGGVTVNGVSKWTGTAWNTKNYPSSYSSNLVLTAAQRPVVAFPVDSSIRVSYVDGASEDYAPAISAGNQPVSPSMAIDAADHIIVVWVAYDGVGRNVQVARWTGTEWDRSFGSLSAVATAGTDTASPAVALDPSGAPIVVWQQPDVRKSTYVRKSNR